jgi:hypothetical protein
MKAETEIVIVRASDVVMRVRGDDGNWGGWVLDGMELSYPAYPCTRPHQITRQRAFVGLARRAQPAQLEKLPRACTHKSTTVRQSLIDVRS